MKQETLDRINSYLCSKPFRIVAEWHELLESRGIECFISDYDRSICLSDNATYYWCDYNRDVREHGSIPPECEPNPVYHPLFGVGVYAEFHAIGTAHVVVNGRRRVVPAIVGALEDHTQCALCEEYFPTDEMCYYDDESFCEGCLPEEEEDISSSIYSYSTNILDLIPVKLNPKVRYYGIELETEVSNLDLIEEIGKCGSFYILKSDSSVTGPEIVTIPMTLQDHLIKWRSLFESIGAHADRSKETTGFHIHISRSTISQLLLGKILCFFNDPFNTDFISSIAGRKPNTYCKIKSDVKVSKKPDFDRFAMVNCCNSETIELRFMRSTRGFKTFSKRLRFVDSVLNWLEYSSVRQLTYKEYLSWLKVNDNKLYNEVA